MQSADKQQHAQLFFLCAKTFPSLRKNITALAQKTDVFCAIQEKPLQKSHTSHDITGNLQAE